MIAIYWIIEFIASCIEVFSLFRFCVLFTHKPKSNRLIAFFTFLLSTITIICNSISLSSFYITIILVAIYYILLLPIYKKSPIRLFFSLILYTILVFIIDFLLLMLLKAATQTEIIDLANTFSLQRIPITLTSKLLLVIIVEMLYKISPKNHQNNKTATIFLTISTICITIIASILYYTQLISKNNTDYLIFFFFIIMMIMIISIYFIIAYIIKNEEKNSELLLIKQQNNLLNKHISEQEEIFLSWKESIHNHKHKLIAINKMLHQKQYSDAELYIGNELELFKDKAFFVHTENNTIDILLSNKMNIARRQGIIFTTNISITDDLKITDVDLSIILGNLLDNAFEAVQNEIEKNVYLQISTTESLFIIKVANTYTKPELTMETRKEKRFHGIGIKSVKNIVSGYDGKFTLTLNNELVTAIVII